MAKHVNINKLMCDYFLLGNGSITTVQCRSSRFTTNPISFQLFGDSTGGPPTTSYWTRNGVNITNDNTFSISISFTGSHDDAGHRAANYQSTLTVTGRQPGLYQYHVSNRQTSGIRTSPGVLVDGNYQVECFPLHLHIQHYTEMIVIRHRSELCYFSISHPGNPPTGLTLSRVSLERMRVTWTDPDIRPRGGYRIEVVRGNINMTADMSPQEISLTPRSTPYEVTLVSLSRHYPVNNIMESITLNGETLNQLIHFY